MNTNDIRDMETGQWIYWATAVPVTIFVIIMGLWWMGELGNALRWLFRRERSDGYVLARPAGGKVELIPSYFVPDSRTWQETAPSVRHLERRPTVLSSIDEAARPVYRRIGSNQI